MDPLEYKPMQDRIELLCRLILDTDADALAEFVAAAERADSMAPYFDPTAWSAGHGKLRMVIEHARAIRTARREIERAADMAGAHR